MDGEFNKFNQKILHKKDEIESALNDANTQYKLMIIYTGIQNLPPDSQNLIDERLNEINDISNVVSYEVLRQSEVHKIISQGLDNSPIDIDIMLGNWVKIPEPFESICGRISAKDVAAWRDQYYPKIFAPNIRCYLGNTDINDGIIETLRNQPEHFWYYNNGITALCRTVTKKMLGGDKSDSGLFECKDLHIINGAQTIGSVYEANKIYSDHVALAYIPIRLISLEKCPEQFAKLVTKYNNTQNKIDRRDFVSLDPEQERIKMELKFEDVIYIYKTGEIIPSEKLGFTLEDATIALACSMDISFAVRAKDKIGTLWDDINTEPYKILFNRNTNSLKLWKLVQIMKVVEGTLFNEQNNQEKNTSDNRRKLFLTHASKLVLYLVFKDTEIEFYCKDFENKNIEQNQNKIIEKKVIYYLDKVVDAANSLFPNGYPANICRNQTKCKEIISQV